VIAVVAKKGILPAVWAGQYQVQAAIAAVGPALADRVPAARAPQRTEGVYFATVRTGVRVRIYKFITVATGVLVSGYRDHLLELTIPGLT